jgi:hypothetical protein
VVAAAVALALLLSGSLCQGQVFLPPAEFATLGPGLGADPSDSGYYLSLGLRKYINSFTSWQFPDVYQPQVNPLSRLEYPWEQIVGVVKGSYTCSLFELLLEGSGTALVWSGLKAQDSDWQNPADPGQKTTFSEGKAKPRIWTFDASVAAAIPHVPCLKGIAGVRVQQLRFTYTDVLQGTIAELNSNDQFIGYLPSATFETLPGTVIEFGQYYRQLFLGGVVTAGMNLESFSLAFAPRLLYLRFQADVASVTGTNHDEHVLRPGVTSDVYTRGWGWHLNLITGFQFGAYGRIDVEVDFKRIRTEGEMDDQLLLLTFSGARVWSDQAYVGLNGSLRF